jgi:hypothetical protein
VLSPSNLAALGVRGDDALVLAAARDRMLLRAGHAL